MGARKGRGGSAARAEVRVVGFKIAWKCFEDGCNVDRIVNVSLISPSVIHMCSKCNHVLVQNPTQT